MFRSDKSGQKTRKSCPKKKPSRFSELKEIEKSRWDKIDKGRGVKVEWYYQLGKALDKTIQRECSPVSEVMRAVADEVFDNKSMVPTLYSARQFAKIASNELEQLKGLSWAYVHYLITAKTQKRRLALARKARQDGMTVRAFRLLVQEVNGGPNGGGKGRPRKLPEVGPRSALRELQRICREWTALADHFVAIAHNASANERGKPIEWQKMITESVVALRRVNKLSFDCSKLLVTH